MLTRYRMRVNDGAQHYPSPPHVIPVPDPSGDWTPHDAAAEEIRRLQEALIGLIGVRGDEDSATFDAYLALRETGWTPHRAWKDTVAAEAEPAKETAVLENEPRCNQYYRGKRCVFLLDHKGDHEVGQRFIAEGPNKREMNLTTWPNIKQWEGTFVCPICGTDSPHEHTSEEIAQFRCKSTEPAKETP